MQNMNRLLTVLLLVSVLSVTEAFGQIKDRVVKPNRKPPTTTTTTTTKPKPPKNSAAKKWKYQGDYYEGLAAVLDDNDKWGFIDETGKVVIPCQWKNAGYFSKGQAAVLDANGKWHTIDKTGKIVE